MGRLNWNHTGRSRWSRSWLAIGIVSLTGCIHALWWRDTLLAQRNDIVERADRLSRRAAMQRRPAPPAVPAALDAVFAEMRYPWMDMLDSLSTATPPGVDLLALEPDTGALRRVHINGVAGQAQRVFDLIVALQSDSAWSSVQLVSQTNVGNATPAPVQHSIPPLPSLPGLPDSTSPTQSFSLLAEWGPP